MEPIHGGAIRLDLELNKGLRRGALVMLRGACGQMTRHLGSRRLMPAKLTGADVFLRHASLSSPMPNAGITCERAAF
jgi:hypothetical protein